MMKQKEYCRPEMVSLAVVSENILCVSKIGVHDGTEGFGINGKLDEVDW